MTSSFDEKIKTLYELEGLLPEVIAQEEGMAVVAIKAKLMQISSTYRKACGREPEVEDKLNFNKSEQEEMKDIILDAARSAETFDGRPDWKTKFAAATYVRDDAKGRKDIRNAMIGNQFNILQLNEKLQEGSERAKRMKELVEV